MEENVREQVNKIRPLISGISGDASSAARWELKYIRKVFAEGMEGVPRLLGAFAAVVLCGVLALITFVIALSYLISAAGIPLWASFGIVTLLLIGAAAGAFFIARQWIVPQLNVFNRLKEHWSRCLSTVEERGARFSSATESEVH